MKLQGRRGLILTTEEKEILNKASDILYKIADLMEQAVSVEWSDFEDDDIWNACEIVDYFAEKDSED